LVRRSSQRYRSGALGWTRDARRVPSAGTCQACTATVPGMHSHRRLPSVLPWPTTAEVDVPPSTLAPHAHCLPQRPASARRAAGQAAVATPGRMADLIKMKACTMARVTYVVLDEADRMFDMGFEPQVRGRGLPTARAAHAVRTARSAHAAHKGRPAQPTQSSPCGPSGLRSPGGSGGAAQVERARTAHAGSCSCVSTAGSLPSPSPPAKPQVRSLMGQVRPDRQVLLFSATMPKKVRAPPRPPTPPATPGAALPWRQLALASPLPALRCIDAAPRAPPVLPCNTPCAP
jgi:hypothetical protein